MIFGNNFWPGGRIDPKSMLLKCILHDLFRDSHNAKFSIRCVYSGEPNKVEGVSLKRSCKIQLRRIDFGSIRPLKCYDPFWPNFTIVIEKLRLAIEKNYVNKAICSGRKLGCWVSQVSQVYRTKKEETSIVLDQSIADTSSPLSKLSKKTGSSLITGKILAEDEVFRYWKRYNAPKLWHIIV